jgi:hypothetical protein
MIPASLEEFVELYTDSAKPPPLHKFQQFLTHAWQLYLSSSHHSQNLFNNKQQSATINACSQKWASIWLTCLPSRPDIRVSNPVYRSAVCLRLSIPPVNLFPDWKSRLLCSDCNANLLEDPFHRIHCTSESANGRRVQHNQVNTKFANFVDKCGHNIEKEPGVFLDPTTKRRPDGFIRLNDGGNMIYDVRGFDSLAPSYIDKDMSKVMSDAAQLKLTKYENHGKVKYPDMKMKAIIFDTLSGLSPSAIRLMKSISNKGDKSSQHNPQKYVHDAIAAISVAIQVDNHAMVMSSFQNARP